MSVYVNQAAGDDYLSLNSTIKKFPIGWCGCCLLFSEYFLFRCYNAL